MGVETLRTLLLARAEEAAAARLRRAHEEAAALRAEQERTVARRLSRALLEEEARLRDALRRELAEARAEARRREIEARGALLDRVFARAEAELEACAADPAWRRGLAGRLAAALDHLEGPVVVEASPALAPALREALAGLAPGGAAAEVREDDAVPAGFRVRRQDGLVTVDATLAARLAARRPRLESEALRILAEPS